MQTYQEYVSHDRILEIGKEIVELGFSFTMQIKFVKGGMIINLYSWYGTQPTNKQPFSSSSNYTEAAKHAEEYLLTLSKI